MAHPTRWGSINQRLAARNLNSMRGYICAACARSQRRSFLTTTNPIRQNQFKRQAGFNVLTRRSLQYDEHKDPENAEDLQSTIDNLRLTTEFEVNNNIREYLRKWQDQNINQHDPIRGPGTSNANPLQSQRVVGNMMNDSQSVYDSAIERSNSDIDESAEYKIDMDENYDVAEILEPGDLVGFYSTTTLATPAIYVRSLERQKQYYTLRGKWRVASDRDIDIVIKRFASKELIDTIIPYFPDTAALTNTNMQELTEGGVPRSAAAPLITMLQDFDEQAKTLYRENAKRMDDLYVLIASADERQVLTLHNITAKALNIDLEDVTPAALFMTHKALQRIPFLIVPDRSSLFSTKYLVHPKSFAKDINTVMGWVRDHQDHLTRVALQKPSDFKNHPLQRFLHKAQKLILQSRKFRSPTTMASVGPSAHRFPQSKTAKQQVYQKEVTAEFDSEDERKILTYLLHFSVPPRRLNMSFARYAAIHIMRATGLYNSIELQRGAIPLLLQELGILTPWDNLYALDQLLGLPGHDIDLIADKFERLARAAANRPENYEVDRMEHMRTDWEDLPIYCIDDPGAKEIDDGISLESVPGTKDTFWLRVHIANPTAFVPHNDPIAENAARRLSTVYLPERHYPMMPTFFTNKAFSLANGRPTLTISAKVNVNGDILETDIKNGQARNVIHLSHGRVREILEGDRRKSQTFTIGGKVPERFHQEKPIDLTKEQIETFHTLRKIMANINTKWRENGGLTWPDNDQKNPLVFIGNEESLLSMRAPGKYHGGYYLGDPVVEITSNKVDPYNIPDLSKTNIVALVMRFACHVAGRWSADRNIPLVYDGTYFHPEYPPLTPEKLARFTADDWLRFAPPKGHSASSVLAHSGLGVDAYTKTTSPLRRYTDLLAHYQIEAALRYEKEHCKKFNGDDAETASLLPFSKDDVDQVLENMKAQFPLMKAVQNQSKTFWTCQFLFRAFYFGECDDLPETFPCLVRQKLQNPNTLGTNYVGAYTGDNLPFGIRARLFVTEEFNDLDQLSTVEAKIVAVNMAQHVVDMEVVKKVKSWERAGDWA